MPRAYFSIASVFKKMAVNYMPGSAIAVDKHCKEASAGATEDDETAKA